MNSYVSLAKQAVENYIKEENIIEPPKDLPEEFSQRRAGTFVTIMENGNLRGCIGTYLPTRPNIAEEIIHNAVAAATEDYRFGSIKKEKLPKLSYTVYILSYPEPVKDLKELNPKKFGIIVKTTPFAFSGRRDKSLLHLRYRSVNEDVVFDGHIPFKSGLLLPDLPGVDNVEKQFLIACQKGGIDPSKEKIFIYRFTVKKYE